MLQFSFESLWFYIRKIGDKSLERFGDTSLDNQIKKYIGKNAEKIGGKLNEN